MEATLKAMFDAGLVPGPAAWHVVISAYIASNHTDLAIDAVRRCHLTGVAPSLSSLEALVLHLTLTDDVAKAEALLQVLQQRGLNLQPLWLAVTSALF